MKIVQINSECDRGSTGRIAVAISKILTGEGIENYVFYSGNHKSNYVNGVQIGSKIDLRFHQALSRFFGDQGFHSTLATWRLVRKLEEINPDIIHLHNLHGYYLNLDILFHYLANSDAKVVWTLHDCWAFTGHCTHFALCGCDKWKKECSCCPQPRVYPYSWFFDRSKELFRRKKALFQSVKDMTLVTPSIWLADLVKESYLGMFNVRVINNGINLSVFKPTESNFRKCYGLEEKFVLLGVSSVWHDKKGLDVFIELSKRLNPEKYQIVLVGTDAQVDKQLPSNIISIHRTQNQTELAEIYTAADVFLNPTREDNYPTVNMEAIACGTPVITFNTGGSPECIDEKSGVVVPYGDVEAMAESIEFVCNTRTFLKEDCIAKAASFDQDKKYREYLELMEDINKR